MAGMAPATRLFEEILEEIFLRLPSPEDLARAATASPAFRRIITSRPFLRRFRELHPPPLLGFATEGGTFQPATDPHPSAPLARAFAAAANFKYASFVPKPDGGDFTRWTHRDARDGRVLLMCTRLSTAAVGKLIDSVFAVCDPLFKRHVLLPPLPVAVDSTLQQERCLLDSDNKLVPAAASDDRDFRVICWANYVSSFVVFIFYSAAGRWRMYKHSSRRWRSLADTDMPTWRFLSNFNFVDGCFYWTSPWRNDVLLELDTSTMEFSTEKILFSDHMQLINLPDESTGISNSIVVPTEEAIEMFTLVQDYSTDRIGSFHLYHTTQQYSDGEFSVKLKIAMALPPGSCYFTVGVNEGFLFLRGVQEAREYSDEGWGVEDLFTLEIKTSELKKVYGGAPCLNAPKPVRSYFGFPPSLSKPSL